ncbi:hypothetical protein JZ785_07775 [Alicyclobacillus curvatus]|nr:hypothetical protein JZ785_07775 [Alicyclobacillus curvatus]
MIENRHILAAVVLRSNSRFYAATYDFAQHHAIFVQQHRVVYSKIW